MAGYYDIDDIITEEEPLSVIFQEAVNGVGIDPSSEQNCVEQGSKVELPFWLASELRRRNAVVAHAPASFDQKTRLEVLVDPACVDLRSRSPYFYELGCKVIPITRDRDIGLLLFSAFKKRYKEVLAKAHTSGNVACRKSLSRLTKEEVNLYEAAQMSMAAFKQWRIGGSRLQCASVLGMKRKSTD